LHASGENGTAEADRKAIGSVKEKKTSIRTAGSGIREQGKTRAPMGYKSFAGARVMVNKYGR